MRREEKDIVKQWKKTAEEKKAEEKNAMDHKWKRATLKEEREKMRDKGSRQRDKQTKGQSPTPTARTKIMQATATKKRTAKAQQNTAP